jgi:hypothetical protein
MQSMRALRVRGIPAFNELSALARITCALSHRMRTRLRAQARTFALYSLCAFVSDSGGKTTLEGASGRGRPSRQTRSITAAVCLGAA